MRFIVRKNRRNKITVGESNEKRRFNWSRPDPGQLNRFYFRCMEQLETIRSLFPVNCHPRLFVPPT